MFNCMRYLIIKPERIDRILFIFYFCENYINTYCGGLIEVLCVKRVGSALDELARYIRLDSYNVYFI